jgi:hypothetical protein
MRFALPVGIIGSFCSGAGGAFRLALLRAILETAVTFMEKCVGSSFGPSMLLIVRHAFSLYVIKKGNRP